MASWTVLARQRNIFKCNFGTCLKIQLDNSFVLPAMVTGRVGSVTTSAVKSLDAPANILDASAKSLDASASYFGRVGELIGRVGELLWTRRRNPWTRRRRFGHLGGTRLVASASIPLRRQIFWTPRHIIFIAWVHSVIGEMCFQDVVYISLDSMACGMTRVNRFTD